MKTYVARFEFHTNYLIDLYNRFLYGEHVAKYTNFNEDETSCDAHTPILIILQTALRSD